MQAGGRAGGNGGRAGGDGVLVLDSRGGKGRKDVFSFFYAFWVFFFRFVCVFSLGGGYLLVFGFYC